MKAWGLTVSVPCEFCDKNCPYCISEMTGFVGSNPDLVERNMQTVYTIAKNSQILNFLITSKREPMINVESVLKMAYAFREYPVEIQTNGIKLNRSPEILKDLYSHGVNTIAFSIDRIGQLHHYLELLKETAQKDIMVRICLNITDMIPLELGFVDIFQEIEKIGMVKHLPVVRQLLFRNVSIPSNVTSGKQYEWIQKHTSRDRYLRLAQEFDLIIDQERKKPIRTLPFDGSRVWSHHGISVAFSDYCIQETNNTADVRSLIYLEDGHLYTSWNDPASILF